MEIEKVEVVITLKNGDSKRATLSGLDESTFNFTLTNDHIESDDGVQITHQLTGTGTILLRAAGKWVR